jgi:tetratricopeptide (TPR) repeat protein
MKTARIDFLKNQLSRIDRFASRTTQRAMVALFGPEPGIIFGMTMGGDISRSADFHIGKAKQEVAAGRVGDAIIYLEKIVVAYLKRKDTKNANACLTEAQNIYEKANDPRFLEYGLRLAEHNFYLDKPDRAGVIIARVIEHINLEKIDAKRDQIRFAVILTLKNIGMLDKAVEVASQMEGEVSSFDTLRRLAGWYKEAGERSRTKALLVSECLQVARHPERFSYPERHVLIAKDLIEIAEKDEAEKVLDETATFLLKKGWAGLEYGYKGRIEEVAILLLKIGKRDKAIRLITEGMINEQAQLSADEIGKIKEALIMRQWPRFHRALGESK